MADYTGLTGLATGGASPLLQQWRARTSAQTIGAGLKPGQTASVTYPTYAQPSPEVLGILSNILGTDPYAQVHQAYENVAQEMARAYQSRGSQAARTQQQAALATGLTPLEASGAGEEALLENMRAYYGALPQLRLAQALLPAERQQQLAGLAQLAQNIYTTPGPTYQFGLTSPAGRLGTTTMAGAGGAMGSEQPTVGTLEWAQAKLALAQAAELARQTAAREQMNRLFYSGGLGPIAGGVQAGGWPTAYAPAGGAPAPAGTPAGGGGYGTMPAPNVTREAYDIYMKGSGV